MNKLNKLSDSYARLKTSHLSRLFFCKFKKRIEQNKQEIKQRRAWINQDKKRLHHFDDKISKALSITAENYDKEMKKNCIDV